MCSLAAGCRAVAPISPPFLVQQQAITDQEFFGNILSSLPGVDPNDAQIQELLRNYNPTAGSADGDKDKKDKKEEKK